MRYEWRKSLESGYEKEMQEVRKKVQDSKTEIRTGPTTIGALGSHYEQQLQRLKQAEQKMDARASNVADVIKARSPKDSAQDQMFKAQPIINDDIIRQKDKERFEQRRQLSLEN